MKYTVAAMLTAAAGVVAGDVATPSPSPSVYVTTEIVDSYTTYCPGATEITHNGHTYTVTEATTLTITDCPCTITRSVTSTAVVSCPTPIVTPTWTSNYVAPPTGGSGGSNPPPTGGVAPPATTPSSVPSSAGKAAALSGAAMAGLIGLAAFVL